MAKIDTPPAPYTLTVTLSLQVSPELVDALTDLRTNAIEADVAIAQAQTEAAEGAGNAQLGSMLTGLLERILGGGSRPGRSRHTDTPAHDERVDIEHPRSTPRGRADALLVHLAASDEADWNDIVKEGLAQDAPLLAWISERTVEGACAELGADPAFVARLLAWLDAGQVVPAAVIRKPANE